jgi:hypothetical protein
MIPPHLKEIPEYLVDPITKEASQIVKLTRAAMGIDNGPKRKHRPCFRKGSGKTSDPLRTFSAEVLSIGGSLSFCIVCYQVTYSLLRKNLIIACSMIM